MKRLLVLGLLFLGFVTVSPSPGQEKVKQKINEKVREEIEISNATVHSFCIESHVFVVVVGHATGTAVGGTGGYGYSNPPSLVQVYEESNGKALPKKCKE